MASEWRETTLGEVVDFDSGHRNSQDAVESGKFPFFTCSQEILRHSEFDFDTEAVIMAGNNADARFHLQYFNGKFAARQRTYIITPASYGLDCRFLYYALHGLQPLFAAQSQGTTTKFVTIGILKNAPIALPPLPEQRAIAHILGTLDDKIELNRRMNETLEAMARALFKSWFVDFDPVRAKAEGRDPGLPQPLADLFPDRFEDSELGEIPAGWEVGTLGDVAEHPRRGVHPDEIDASTPYIALEHMPKRCIALSEWGVADGLESNKFEFKRGEILFGKLRPYFHKIGVAPVDGVCSTDIVVVAACEDKWFGFVLSHVSSTAFVDYADAGSTGTKMPRTTWDQMARYPLIIPAATTAEAFTSQIQAIVHHMIASTHESRTLAALRDALLPKLISGEVQTVRQAARANWR